MRPHSSQNYSGTTPPGRHSPLTPPATAERSRPIADASDANAALIRLLESYRNRGKSVNFARSAEIAIDQKSYRSHLELIKRSFKRFDYDPNHGLLFLRMPSPIHDYFANILAQDLQNRLNDIVSGDDKAGAFASEIRSGGSSTITLSEGDSESFEDIRREPDAQFRHPRSHYPGVVIEVSFSQDAKNLQKLAQDYILYSNGDIKAVVGIDIDYRGKESTVSLWRPKYTSSEDGGIEQLEIKQVLSHEPFRSSDGRASNAEKWIVLNLSDFATDTLSAEYESIPVTIAFRRLFDILQEAEKMGPDQETSLGESILKSSRATRKRRLSSSSAEQILSEDEASYAKLEKAAIDRANRDDKAFKGPVIKRRG